MRRSPVVGNLFSGMRALPVAMFTGRALNKRCVPYPVHPLILQILLQTVNCNSSPDNVSGGCGGRLQVLFRSAGPPANVETF